LNLTRSREERSAVHEGIFFFSQSWLQLGPVVLVCVMYAGFKRIEPGMDIRVDRGEEWGMAERLEKEERI